MVTKCVVSVSSITEDNDIKNYSETNLYDLIWYADANKIQKHIIYNRNTEKPIPEEMQFWIDYSLEDSQTILETIIHKLQLVFSEKKHNKNVEEEIPF